MAVALALPSVSQANTPPVPFIQVVSPPSAAPPANTDLTLTLTGSGFSDGNFTPASTVLFDGPNGAATLTTTASLCDVALGAVGVCAQLTVIIPAADVVTGTAIITALNPSPSAMPQPAPLESNPVAFPMSVSETNVAFGNASVTVGMNPQGIAAGDFNGDGIEDLAVVNAADNFPAGRDGGLFWSSKKHLTFLNLL